MRQCEPETDWAFERVIIGVLAVEGALMSEMLEASAGLVGGMGVGKAQRERYRERRTGGQRQKKAERRERRDGEKRDTETRVS